MPITLRWLDKEKTILISEITGIWTLAEVFEITTKRGQILDTVDYTIDAIAHFLPRTSPPSGLFSNMGQFGKGSAFTHPNSGKVIIIIDDSPLISSIATVFSRAIRRVQVAETIEEAQEIIYAARSVSAP